VGWAARPVQHHSTVLRSGKGFLPGFLGGMRVNGEPSGDDLAKAASSDGLGSHSHGDFVDRRLLSVKGFAILTAAVLVVIGMAVGLVGGLPAIQPAVAVTQPTPARTHSLNGAGLSVASAAVADGTLVMALTVCPGLPQLVPRSALPEAEAPGVVSPTVEVFRGDRLVFTPTSYDAPRRQQHGPPGRTYRLALEPGRYLVTTTTSSSEESVMVNSDTVTHISVYAGFSHSANRFRACAT
jgi:hypothetical protein